MESSVVLRLSALAHEGRLAVFRLLVRRQPDAVAAGEIGAALHVKPSTLSVHLSALRQAGLVTQRREGRSLLYAAEMRAAGDLLSFLFADCCRGRPGLCPPLDPLTQGVRPMSRRPYNVLFICTGNSARSIFGEAILRHEAGDRFRAFSAGTRPRSEINPFALEMLRGRGYDVSPLRAKTIAEFQGAEAPRMDFVFTVCDRAANEECPPWPGQPISAHWGLPDPVKARGTDAQRRLAFQEVYAALRNRIRAFTALPIESLDRVALQAGVDDIAAMTGTMEGPAESATRRPDDAPGGAAPQA